MVKSSPLQLSNYENSTTMVRTEIPLFCVKSSSLLKVLDLCFKMTRIHAPPHLQCQKRGQNSTTCGGKIKLQAAKSRAHGCAFTSLKCVFCTCLLEALQSER